MQALGQLMIQASFEQGRPLVPVIDAGSYLEAVRRDPCCYCGKATLAPMALDHIDPVYGGGEDDWYNRAGICKACNSAKGTRELLMHLLAVRIQREIHPLREQLDLIAGGPIGPTAIARETAARRVTQAAADQAVADERERVGRLERVHICRVIRSYGPGLATFICDTVNAEYERRNRDRLPPVSRRAITGKLLVMSTEGLVSPTWYDDTDGPAVWSLTDQGGALIEAAHERWGSHS